MARSLFKFPGFITKERNSSTELPTSSGTDFRPAPTRISPSEHTSTDLSAISISRPASSKEHNLWHHLHQAGYVIHWPGKLEVRSSELAPTVIPVPDLQTRPCCQWWGFVDSQNTVKLPVKYHTNATTDVISSLPITCRSDQQAGHMTHQPAIASKNSSQGLSQQLSNLQIRCALKRNTLLMEETCSKLNSTQKIVVKFLQQLVTECTTGTGYTALYSLPDPTSYRVIRPSPFNSVLILGQVSTRYGFNRLVTEPTDRVPTTQPCSLYLTLPVTESTYLVHLCVLTLVLNQLYVDSWSSSGAGYTVLTIQCFTPTGYRELLVTVNYRVWRPGTRQSCLR